MPPLRQLLLALVTASPLACADGSDDDAADSTASSSSTPSSEGSSTAPASSSAPAESSTAASEGGDGLLQCIETCGVPSECCLPGMPCPGPYPHNVDCQDGLCTRPSCIDDAECAALGDGMICRPVRGVATCVLPCSDDAGCTALGAHQVCRGTTDTGEQHCFEHCDQPGVFCGNQTCDTDSGLCVCAGDGQCQSGWTCRD